MKPLRIVMSAFGSYAGEEVVDFEKIGHGIFLITGDTGAGKTTIFDGVAYALFGECSVSSRDGSMMRSQYAADGQETYVSLRFSQQGKVYEVTRSPAYSRVSRRKNKEGEYARIQVQAKARLLLPDGTQQPGNVRDVNRKLQEIVGVDFDQFSQIAMIAQGDYLKLLHASSRDRKEIFSRIFHTGIYGRIQQRLREENNRLYDGLEDNRKLVSHELENVEAPDEAWAETWGELLRFRETGTGRIREALSGMLDETAVRQQKQRGLRRETERECAALEAAVHRAEEENRLFSEWEAERVTLSRLMEQAAQQEEKRECLALARRAEKVAGEEKKFVERRLEEEKSRSRQRNLAHRLEDFCAKRAEAERSLGECSQKGEARLPAIRKRILRIRDLLPLFGEWKRAEQAFAAAQREAQKAQEACRLAQEAAEESAARQRKLAARGEELEESAASLAQLEQKKEQALVRKERLAALRKAVGSWQRETQELSACQESLAGEMENYDRAEAEYGRAYRIFLEAQAGLMASSLEEGQACPVCGSVHHPSLAGLPGERVTQADVEDARQARDEAEKSRSAASWAAVRTAESCRQREERIREELQALAVYAPGAAKADAQEIVQAVEAALSSCKKHLDETEKKRVEASEAKQLLTENRKQQRQEEALREKAEERRIAAQAFLQEKEVALAERRIQAEQLKKRLPGEEEWAIRAELAGLEAEEKALGAEWEAASARRDELLQEERETKGSLRAEEENAELLARAASQAQKAYHTMIGEQGFSSTEEWKEVLQEEAKMVRLEQECREYEEKLLRSRTICEQYQRQLAGKEPKDIREWQERVDALRGQQEGMEREENRLAGIHSRNLQAFCNLERLWKSAEGLEEEYGLIHTLYETANGRITGSIGLDFQTYVQRQYFTRMIEAANRRLKVMAEGAFLLQCRELDALGKQGEVGLDLDVYSLVTDKVRDVKTLSGGESFLAALAMALGMADVIAQTVGNVKIDALFIDEGFGALDEESRLRAIRILQQLAEGKRLVGIISHVPELKEQMERQIVVKKTEKGSHIEWRI